MKVDKRIVILGLFNIVGYLFVEMALVSNWIGNIHSFNTLSAFGIALVLFNGIGLWYSIKSSKVFIINVSILIAIVYGIYQIVSINAIGYRIILLLDGVLLCGASSK